MPRRGELWSEFQGERSVVAVVEGDPDAPVWAPYARPALTVVLPSEHVGAGQPVRELPCVGVFGPDLVFGEYVYLEGRRVVSAAGDLDLDLDLDPAPVLQSSGGALRHTYLVLRVVGEARDTYAGEAYDVEPCVRLSLPVDAAGAPTPPADETIAWVVHHPHQRASRVEVDFEAAAAFTVVPEPVVEAAPEPRPITPVAVLVDPGPMGSAVHVAAPVSARAIDVLPAATAPARRRGLFGRRG